MAQNLPTETYAGAGAGFTVQFPQGSWGGLLVSNYGPFSLQWSCGGAEGTISALQADIVPTGAGQQKVDFLAFGVDVEGTSPLGTNGQVTLVALDPDDLADYLAAGTYPCPLTAPSVPATISVTVDFPTPLEVAIYENSASNPVFVSSSAGAAPNEFRYCVLGATTDPVTVVPAPAIGQVLKVVRAEVVPNTAAAGGYLETSNNSVVLGMARIGQPHDSEWQTPQGVGFVSIVGHGASVANPVDFAVHVNIQGAVLPPGGSFALVVFANTTGAYDLVTGANLWFATGATIGVYGQACCSPDGTKLCTINTALTTLYIWKLNGGTAITNFAAPAGYTNAQWATDNILVVATSAAGNQYVSGYNATTGALIWGPNQVVGATSVGKPSSGYVDGSGFVWWEWLLFMMPIDAATGAFGPVINFPANFETNLFVALVGGDVCVGGLGGGVDAGKVFVMAADTATQVAITNVTYALASTDVFNGAAGFITDGQGQVWACDNGGNDYIVDPSTGASVLVAAAANNGTSILNYLSNFVGSDQFVAGAVNTAAGAHQFVGLMDVDAYSMTLTAVELDTLGGSLACCVLA